MELFFLKRYGDICDYVFVVWIEFDAAVCVRLVFVVAASLSCVTLLEDDTTQREHLTSARGKSTPTEHPRFPQK